MAQDRAIRQDSLRKKLSTLPNDTAKVNLLNKLAASYLQINQDSITSIAQRAKALAEQIKYEKGIADATLYIAIVKRQRGNYIAALDEFLSSIKIYEQLKATSSQAGGYLHIAQVYKDMSGSNLTLKYLEKGIDYSQLAYQLYHSKPDTAGMVDALSSQGIIYRDMGKMPGREHYYDTAYRVYTQALQLIRSGKGTQHTGKLYNNISQVYLEHKKDYTKALDYLFQAVAFNKSHHNFSSLSFNYGNISNVYVKLNNPTQALLYARKMEETALQLHWPERLVNAYRQLHTSFQASRQYDSALHYYVLADKLDDSLNNVAKTNEVVDLQTKYETAKKESQIQTLRIESSDKNKRITVLVIGVIVFAALAVCMIWLYRRVKKQRQQIALQSKNLETMMKELHHRVKNNLQIVSSLLSLQTYKVQDAGAVSVLRESQQRVQAMSFIHQRLYKKDELTSVNMKEYFTDLAESLLASYGFDRDHFDLQIRIDREMMDIDKALPIGLIINEMITNSLKYAYRDIQHPSLLISLTEDTSNMVFLIRDNGIGINEETWKQKSNSFGKQLIGALCKQMRAKQTLVIDGGTAFTITIPREVA
ncbi:tetratricopeptide repeat-containing sensor histidine kinase [Paraflavitalea devenefica]|uniref:tetratricopeptide repeat-containing sensor histidine kinase n=1 Tax=Paraflavitalea devenefica TaxID=2716334 RepID=UPI001421DA3C|nr:histidine kinase dimerization/phosphoacceptor domain -containing protein [Paraflavitalea devenefica]